MSGREQVDFAMRLDSRQFDAQMAKSRSAAVSLGGSTKKMGESFKAAGDKIGAAAGAVSGLNGAMGNAVGTTNAFAGAAGGIASAFAGGGIVGLAIAGATTAIGYYWEETARAKKEVEDFAKAAEERKVKALREVKDAARAAMEELANYGKTSKEVRLQQVNEELIVQERQVELSKRMVGALSDQFKALNKQTFATEKAREAQAEQLEVLRQAIATQGARRRQAEEILEPLREEQFAISSLMNIEVEREENNRKAANRKAAKAAFQKSEAEAEKLRMAFAVQTENDLAKAEEWNTKKQEALEKEQHAARLARAKELADAQRRAAEEQRAQAMETGMVVAGNAAMVAGIMGQLAHDLATQQEDAFARAAIAFLQSIGQQIAGEGLKQIAQGTGMLILGDPRGGALLATGTGFLAAGTAMATTGQIIGTNISANTQTGGGGGATSSGSSFGGGGGGGGVPARWSGGGGGGGGPAVINIVYGAAGPRPEDTAAAVAGALSTARERGLAPGRRARP